MAKLEDHLSKAQRLAEKGKWRDALAEYDRAVALDPNDARIRLKLSDAAIKSGDARRAADALADAASIYERSGFALKAVATLRDVLTLDPSRAAVHLDLARLYAHLALHDEAAAHVDRFVATLPRDDGAHGYREGDSIAHRAAHARARFLDGDVEGAVADLRALDGRHPLRA